MHITTTKLNVPSYATQKSSVNAASAASDEAQAPQDNFSFSDGDGNLAMAGMGIASGVVGIGAPAALLMGGAKQLMSGNYLTGAALGVGGVLVGGTVGMAALMGAAMSSDAGSGVGFNSYLAAGAVTTAAAGFAIF